MGSARALAAALGAISLLAGWFVVSQMARREAGPASAGSIVAYRPGDGALRVLYPPPMKAPSAGPKPGETNAGDPSCPGPPPAATFAPHGIDVVAGPGGAHLLAVDHGGREAIEIFAVEGDAAAPALAWQGCVPLPEDAQANDVAGGEALIRMDGSGGPVQRAQLGFHPDNIPWTPDGRLWLGTFAGDRLAWREQQS